MNSGYLEKIDVCVLVRSVFVLLHHRKNEIGVNFGRIMQFNSWNLPFTPPSILKYGYWSGDLSRNIQCLGSDNYPAIKKTMKLYSAWEYTATSPMTTTMIYACLDINWSIICLAIRILCAMIMDFTFLSRDFYLYH